MQLSFCLFYLRFIEFLKPMNKCFLSNWVNFTILPPNIFLTLCFLPLLWDPHYMFLGIPDFPQVSEVMGFFPILFCLFIIQGNFYYLSSSLLIFLFHLKSTVEPIVNYLYLLLYISSPKFPFSLTLLRFFIHESLPSYFPLIFQTLFPFALWIYS